MPKWLILFLFSILCSPSIIAAQANCPAVVTAALNTTAEFCADLGRNQACYGNASLEATPRSEAPEFSFIQAGDVVNVADIDSLRLSSLSLTDETWGIATMRLQANLPDTLPGQNVTVLIFGDVEITNAVTTVLTELEVITIADVNVRLRPTTTQNNIIWSFTMGETVIANGRLEDNSWVRIVLDAETQAVGWISADFISSESNLEGLAIIDDADASQYGPMQAFYFVSGVSDRLCAEAPDSGILIQTPLGAGEVILRVNDVEIRLASTIYLQASGGLMTVSVIEGHAVLTADEVSQTVPAGTYAQIPLDANGLADGAPTYPQPYSSVALRGLREVIAISMPQDIDLAAPIQSESAIDAAITIAEGLPPSGLWAFTRVVTQPGCGVPPAIVGSVIAYDISISFNEDHSVMYVEAGSFNGAFTRSSDLNYQWSGDGDNWIITFTSPTTFVGESAQGDIANTDPCVYHTSDSGVFIG